MTSQIVNFRKLVALDIILHGRKFILIEFGLGTPFMFALGLHQLLFGLDSGLLFSQVIGFYLILIGVNYVPILIYAVVISWKDSAYLEAAAELDYKSRYNKQQFLIFIPLLVFFVAVAQEVRSHTSS
jgi:hypothetical protein